MNDTSRLAINSPDAIAEDAIRGLFSTRTDPWPLYKKLRETEVFRAQHRTGRSAQFGYGMHICLGMWLARMEIEEVLNAMLDRISRIEFAGGSAVIPRAPESSRLGQLMLKVA